MSAVSPPASAELLELYDAALPHVYGYLLRRCGGHQVAEDLTAETFLAAVDTVRRGVPVPLGIPWLIGVARHKLVDHWRREGRTGRNLEVLAARAATDPAESPGDPWDERLDALTAHATLLTLPPHYRNALSLRYLDDRSVPEMASILGVSVHTTEGLLARARAAFRRAYPTDREGDDA